MKEAIHLDPLISDSVATYSRLLSYLLRNWFSYRPNRRGASVTGDNKHRRNLYPSFGVAGGWWGKVRYLIDPNIRNVMITNPFHDQSSSLTVP